MFAISTLIYYELYANWHEQLKWWKIKQWFLLQLFSYFFTHTHRLIYWMIINMCVNFLGVCSSDDDADQTRWNFNTKFFLFCVSLSLHVLLGHAKQYLFVRKLFILCVCGFEKIIVDQIYPHENSKNLCIIYQWHILAVMLLWPLYMLQL